MTRAEEQALKVYPVLSLTNDTNASKRKYFTDGYALAQQDFIEKACEFLKSYRQDTLDGTGYIAGIVNDKTIEDFRNYMKGE